MQDTGKPQTRRKAVEEILRELVAHRLTLLQATEKLEAIVVLGRALGGQRDEAP